MNSLGSHLKEKREEKGYSIEEVAEATNIASRYLRAIEEHDFSQFPADVYAKGFIRSYAKFLDLDAQSLMMEYSLNFEAQNEATPDTGTRDQMLYWVAISFLVVVGLALVFLRFAWLDPDSVTTRSSAVTSTQSQPQPRSQATNPSSSVARSSRNIDISQAPEKLKIRVVATAKTWVYAVFDGMRKQEFMFQPGDKMTWTAEDTVRVRLGNAGGLRLYYDGERLPGLGQNGEVADKIINLKGDTIQIRSPGRNIGS